MKKINLTFDLTAPAFDQQMQPVVITHTAPHFERRLRKLRWHEEWNTILAGLAKRYTADPLRPHSVYEAFLRGNRGYLALMIAGTTPEQTSDYRGLLYGCTMNLEVSPEERIKALYELGRNALTQWMVQGTGDPNYIVRWEDPQ
jgi:hypothetical protein